VAPPRKKESGGRHAFLVGAGIFLSKIFGLLRMRFMTSAFGQGDIANAVAAGQRIPNLLQNLLGEGVLSGSFIPVYARLLAEDDEEEANRVAGAIFAMLALVAAIIVLAGVFAAPVLTTLIVPGFKGETRELAIWLVRIMFPGVCMMVLSAWCLGILNSHRKFFLSYAAPVAWNLAMIVTLIVFRAQPPAKLAITFGWGFVVGCAVQFGVQIPIVLRLMRRLRPRLETASAQVREVIRNFGPVFVSRGVVQISAYVDTMLASLLGKGVVAAVTYMQTIYLLPVSLFGMSVSAAELPAMSSALGGTAEIAEQLRARLNSGLRQIAFFIVPSAMAFLSLGGVITALLFVTGRFTRADAQFDWAILAGSAIGLLAQTLGRLYSSTYYALRDTRTPLRFAIVRVALTTGLGFICSIPLPHWLGIDPKWGAAGLTGSAGVAGWVEFTLLRRGLNRRIGQTGLPANLVGRLWLSALTAAAVGWGVKLGIGVRHPLSGGAAVVGAYGVTYFAAAWLLRVEECATAVRRVLRFVR
jgi:putative peptidoglycan lipid II flippase